MFNYHYIRFCRIFQDSQTPRIQLRKKNSLFNEIICKRYKISSSSIDKASFFIAIISFISIFMMALLFFRFSILLSFLSSIIFAIIISYNFSNYIPNHLKKEEKILNLYLNIVKLNFSIMQKSLGKNTDLSIDFIRLLSMHDKVLSQEFSVIISKIHRGSNPEKELSEYLSPSEDFNIFLRNYLTQKFTDGFFENELIDTQNEKNVEIFTNSLESRLSLCFFIGIFFPIGMSFLIIFIKFSLIWMIFFIFLYSFFFHKLLGKIINEDHQLIGMINNYSKKETRKLDEFINFISAFALNLKFFSSPEKAFIMSYFDNKSNYRVINGLLDNCTTKLINFQESFYNILDYFAYKLSSVNYFVIINALKKMLKQSSILTSDKISKLVKLVQKHKKLQDKLEEIFYAETFKVIIFIVLLPVIIGSIGGMIPFFDIFTGNIDELKEVSINSFLSFLFIFDIVLLSLILLINVLISIHFFIRIVKIEQKNVLYLLAIFLFIFSFWFSFVNTFQILL